MLSTPAQVLSNDTQLPVPVAAVVASKRQLAAGRLSQRFANAVTAVRGPHTLKAIRYDKLLKEGAKACGDFVFPFDKVIFCNIGNPQGIGQKPITFVRQVLSLLDYPAMLDSPEAPKIFPADVLRRARQLLVEVPGGTGAYSESQGLLSVRRRVAEFIQRRDGGVPCSPDNVYLTDGASPAVQMALQLCITEKHDAIMVPIPQYPLYQGSINLFEGKTVGYYLDESASWGLDIAELERAYAEGVAEGLEIRAIAVINPGNPVGNCLSVENMRAIVKFCVDKVIVLMADEVYQANLYNQGKPFTSFKRVASEEGVLEDLELMSFHSVSKGFFGECGRRGGYIETSNIDEEARTALYRMMALGLCANVAGQLTVGLMVDPPVEGDESFTLYEEERIAITSALERKATLFWEAFNEMEGVTCNRAEGALYLFPQIALPPKAVEAAEAAGLAPDAFYADKLLDGTGIVVVPGSGFRQKPGTHHVRFAFLPAEEAIRDVIDLLKAFHAEFLQKYA